MTSDWKEYNLEDIDIQIIDGDRGKNYPNKKELLSVGDCLFLSAQNVTKDGFNFSEIQWITKEKDNLLKNGKLSYGDIVITTRGTVGNVAFYSDNIKYTNIRINSGMLIIRCGTTICNNYLYYVLSSKNFAQKIKSMQSGTAQPQLPKSHFQKMSIPLPPFEIQQKIAKVLSAIDDKIELNNSINNNLEQQAQAIYRNFIGNCNTQIIKVSDITATANTGADAIQKAPIVDYNTGVKCIRVGDMSNNRDIYQWGYSKVTDEVFKQYQLKKDDILVTRTATLGLNRLITSDLNAVYNNGLIRLTVDKSKIYPLLLYRQFQTSDFFNFISRIESETSVRPNMKINYLLSYEFNCPDIDVQKELIKLLVPLMNLIEHNNHENNRLTLLRDTLLPKLMSGEIDVWKVEV